MEKKQENYVGIVKYDYPISNEVELLAAKKVQNLDEIKLLMPKRDFIRVEFQNEKDQEQTMRGNFLYQGIIDNSSIVFSQLLQDCWVRDFECPFSDLVYNSNGFLIIPEPKRKECKSYYKRNDKEFQEKFNDFLDALEGRK